MKMDLKEQDVTVDSFATRDRPVVGSCEHSNESSENFLTR
jgi:hypothetical protein